MRAQRMQRDRILLEIYLEGGEWALLNFLKGS